MKFFETKLQKIVVIGIAAFLIIGGSSVAIIRGVQSKQENEEKGEEQTELLEITSEMFTAPSALEGLKYNLGNQEVINPGQTEYGTFMYKLENGEWNSTTPLGEFGSYVVSWYIDAKDGYKDYGSKEQPFLITVTIEKGSLSDSQFIAPKIVENLTYTGLEQELVCAGSVITSECGTFMYSLDKESWSTELPKGKNAQQYNIFWFIEGTDFYNNYGSQTTPFTLTNHIEKAKITSSMVTAPVAETEFGLGSLIEPGSTEAGTFMYSVRKVGDEEEYYWQEDIPTFETAGNYIVSWYVDGGDNYESYYDEGDKPFEINVSTTKMALSYTYYPQGISIKDDSTDKLGNEGWQDDPTINYHYSLNKTNWQDDLFFDVEPGQHVVYWYSEENSQYYGVASAEEPMSFLTIVTNLDFVPTIGDDTFLPYGCYSYYNGESQEICSEGITMLTGMGKFMYSLDGITFTQEIPTVTEIGVYEFYYYLTDGITCCGLGNEEYPFIDTAEIAMPYLMWEECPQSVHALYTGEAIELVSFEQAPYGTYYFKVGDENYSTEIPTAVEKGTYTISWYYDGEGLCENEGSAEEPADTFESKIN